MRSRGSVTFRPQTDRSEASFPPQPFHKRFSESMDSKRYEITIEVRSTYVPEQSNESGARYVFAYTITIRNTGTVAAQLISRHWIITDSDSHVQAVRGV